MEGRYVVVTSNIAGPCSSEAHPHRFGPACGRFYDGSGRFCGIPHAHRTRPDRFHRRSTTHRMHTSNRSAGLRQAEVPERRLVLRSDRDHRVWDPGPMRMPVWLLMSALIPSLPVALGNSIPGLPSLIARAGKRASRRFLEFFTVHIRNPNTRAAYGRAAGAFLRWCEERGIAHLARWSRCTSPPTSNN